MALSILKGSAFDSRHLQSTLGVQLLQMQKQLDSRFHGNDYKNTISKNLDSILNIQDFR